MANMNPAEWWKSLGMNREVHAAGAFIYNALIHLHKLSHLSETTDAFEILYGLSVGIERLQKVVIILLEQEESVSFEKLEESLISHNTMELSNRIDALAPQNLSGVHKEFLSLLSKFYKTHRYSRYSFSSIPNIDSEKEALISFLEKQLSIEVPDEQYFSLQNTDQIRKFIGNVVKYITRGLYKTIEDRCIELNIYTYELRADSKAMKVFLGDRLDFINEDIIRREILIYLMNTHTIDKHMDFARSIEPLNLEGVSTSSYIKALLNDIPENQGFVTGMVEEEYLNVKEVSERLEMLNLIDNEYFIFMDDFENE